MRNVAPRNAAAPAAVTPAARERGRARVWRDEAEKNRKYRARRRERSAALDALLQALRNAHWAEPELEHAANYGDDLTLARALTAHFRKRHWMRHAGSGGQKADPGALGANAPPEPEKKTA